MGISKTKIRYIYKIKKMLVISNFFQSIFLKKKLKNNLFF